MPEAFRVEFEPSGRSVDVPSGRSVLEAAWSAGIELASECGGEGDCGRCRVFVVSGAIPTPTSADRRMLAPDQLGAGERLACQVPVVDRLRVNIPPASRLSGQRLQHDGPARTSELAPAVRRYAVTVTSPSMEDARSDVERVVAAAREDHGLQSLRADPAVVRRLSPLLRQTGWRVGLMVRGEDIVSAAPPDRPPLGFAADIGTTKIAGYLVDLENGADLAANGVANPQARFGEDVISRLAHAQRSEGGAEELTATVRATLDELLGSLCESAGASRHEVVDGCFVGNTVMHHLLLGLPTRELSRAPFVAATSDALDIRARDLDIGMAPDARIHVLPIIGGFVGADHVAMILSVDLDRVGAVTIGVDIGTNTEVVLRRPDAPRLTVTSCASGPAFEGAHIRDGMRAARGAIDSVRFDGEGPPRIHTIDDAPALGICGSGIVDAVAELGRTGRMDARGRLRTGANEVRRGERGPEVVLVEAATSGTGRDIAVTQSDINEVQLAKGAIGAGISILLEATHSAAEEVDEIVLAGAFGTFLNLDSALDIGLLPRPPGASYVQVGNAAGAGARAALLSLGERERAQTIARESEYLELTTSPAFGRRFAEAMTFPMIGPGGGRHA